MDKPKLIKTVTKIATWSAVTFAAVAVYFWFSHRSDESEKKRAKDIQQREEKTSKVLSNRNIEPRIFNTEKGQLVVIDVPLPSTLSSTSVEMKRCIIWRDIEMQMPAMSCDAYGALVDVE